MNLHRQPGAAFAADFAASLPTRVVHLHQGFAGTRAFAAGAAVLRADADEGIRFRRFRLLPGARILLRDGRPMELGGRAFDLLHVLLSARGTIVSKADIVRRVWPTTVVEESNLRFQVAAVRRALGEDRDLVKTIAGRGYLFAEDVAEDETPAAEPAAFAAPRPMVPAPMAAAETCEALRDLLRSVLDELWQMSQQGAGGPALSSAALAVSRLPR